jgi:hypothetical protein
MAKDLFSTIVFVLVGLNAIHCLKDTFEKLKKTFPKSNVEELAFEILPFTNQAHILQWVNSYTIPKTTSKTKNDTFFLNYIENNLKNKGYRNFQYADGVYTVEKENKVRVELKIFDFDRSQFFDFSKSTVCCIGKRRKFCKQCQIKNKNSILPVEIAIAIIANDVESIQKVSDVGIVLTGKSNSKVLKKFIGLFDLVNRTNSLDSYTNKCFKSKNEDSQHSLTVDWLKVFIRKFHDINSKLESKGIYHNGLSIESIIIESQSRDKIECNSSFDMKLVNFKNGIVGLKKFEKKSKELTISENQLMLNKDNNKTTVPELNLNRKQYLLSPLLSFYHGLIAAELCDSGINGETLIKNVIAKDLLSFKPKKNKKMYQMGSAFTNFETNLNTENICRKNEKLKDFLKLCLSYAPEERLHFSRLLESSFLKE